MAVPDKLTDRLDRLLDRVESLLPAQGGEPLTKAAPLLRWRRRGAAARLEHVESYRQVRLQDLQCIDRQKTIISRNTRQFIRGCPANNVLLWGARGAGKSSLIKALSHEYAPQGLSLVEVARAEYGDLIDVCAALAKLDGWFIIYCDDMSFAAQDPAYTTLKALLDGTVSDMPANVLVYATSNRRHLTPEYTRDNLDAGMRDGELHPGEAIEERLSLAERFGICLSFHPFTQEQYLQVVAYWLEQLGAATGDSGQTRRAALQWALEKGSRSGRSAAQFARNHAGMALADDHG